MTNNENKTNEINPEALKQWFAEIKDPKQQAIHTNIEILKLETYVKDRNFAKQEQEDCLITESDKIKEIVKQEAIGAERGGPLSSEVKIADEIRKRAKENPECIKIQDCIESIKQDIINTELNISFYKRTFQILIMFANEWVKA
jgi:hypothetical protein